MMAMRQAKSGTILVVDDDRDIVGAIVETLQEEGYRVISASNGLEALTALGAEPVDLILLDLMMPAMNGWDFLEQGAGDPQIAGTPLVVISAMPNDVEPSPFVRAVLAKPFERGALLATVGAHLRRRPA
jgi:two-component system, chemotaxis family, chemotaxis protein CheY